MLKDEDNVCQSAEHITEDEILLQHSQAGIFQEKAIIQYVDGDLRVSTLSAFKSVYQMKTVTSEFSKILLGLI